MTWEDSESHRLKARYKQKLHKAIQREIKIAKDERMKKQCEEMRERKYDKMEILCSRTF